jgi:hypothetical protein
MEARHVDPGAELVLRAIDAIEVMGEGTRVDEVAANAAPHKSYRLLPLSGEALAASRRASQTASQSLSRHSQERQRFAGLQRT